MLQASHGIPVRHEWDMIGHRRQVPSKSSKCRSRWSHHQCGSHMWLKRGKSLFPPWHCHWADCIRLRDASTALQGNPRDGLEARSKQVYKWVGRFWIWKVERKSVAARMANHGWPLPAWFECAAILWSRWRVAMCCFTSCYWGSRQQKQRAAGQGADQQRWQVS